MTEDKKLPPAANVIKGMPPGEISDRMELYEKQYRNWHGSDVDDYGTTVQRSWFTWIRDWQLRFARTPIRIFRAEISALGLECSRHMMADKARDSQAQTYKEYVKMVEANRELRSFLEEHFKQDLKEAESRNVSIPILLKEILLRLKKG